VTLPGGGGGVMAHATDRHEGGRGSKSGLNSVTWFMDDPLPFDGSRQELCNSCAPPVFNA